MKKIKFLLLIVSLIVLGSSLSGCGTGRLFHGPYHWGHGHYYHPEYSQDVDHRNYRGSERYNDDWCWR